MSDVQTRTIESIVKQFRGGEHRLAGQRASILVYGKGKKANTDLVDRIKAAAPGIERYISAPEQPVGFVDDQGGNPLATQLENDPNQNNPSNVSNDKARAEQSEIDEHLNAGGAGKAEKPADVKAWPGSTKLNPEDSASDDKAKSKAKAKPGK